MMRKNMGKVFKTMKAKILVSKAGKKAKIEGGKRERRFKSPGRNENAMKGDK